MNMQPLWSWSDVYLCMIFVRPLCQLAVSVGQKLNLPAYPLLLYYIGCPFYNCLTVASLSLHVEECSTCEASVTLINHHNKSIYFHLWLKRGIDWHQDTYVHTYLWTVCTFLDANVFHYVCTTLTSRGQSWTKGSSEQIPFCTLMVSRVSETSHDWGEILTACVEKLRCLTASCCLTSHIRSGSH